MGSYDGNLCESAEFLGRPKCKWCGDSIAGAAYGANVLHCLYECELLAEARRAFGADVWGKSLKQLFQNEEAVIAVAKEMAALHARSGEGRRRRPRHL